MGERKKFRETREDLAARGFRPSSARGQNFLVDSNLLDAIVRDASIGPGETVIEIGSGPGGLTGRLARVAERIVAFEIDTRLAEFAASELAEFSNIQWVVGDALGETSKHGLHSQLAELLSSENCVLVANLPYNISAPLLANVMAHSTPPIRAIAMVQKEVADRLAANESSGDYGPLTIAVQVNAHVEKLRDVPREVFRPRPNVSSTVLRLTPRPSRPDADEAARLRKLIALAFQGRRKMLAPRLEPWFGGRAAAEAAIVELGYSPRARGEELSVDAFRALARRAPRP